MRKMKHGRLPFGCRDACCLKLDGLSVSLQGDPILEDVSFHLHCGEIAALIGPNGAGKSTLFRSILGQLSYRGNITFSPAGGPAIRLA
ncbi:MAG: ATP-binding cassette domain-containing protein, partial [Lawsonibacter sp.]|nr:ATP-binding cassette domain-containing protein [Lawsonibacter sp.]